MLALEREPQIVSLQIPIVEMAKPGIPIEKPQRRQNPDIVNPVPQRLPTPAEPVRIPREPVPVTR